MKLGKGYKGTVAAIEGYRSRFIAYLNSQKEDGYILHIDNDLDKKNDVVTFKMGQHTFILQMICHHQTLTIFFKTYGQAKYPERHSSLHIIEMDILCEGVDERYLGIASFRVEKQIKDAWGNVENISQLRDFNVDYIYYLDICIKDLYDPRRK